jgi:hypothetical protein
LGPPLEKRLLGLAGCDARQRGVADHRGHRRQVLMEGRRGILGEPLRRQALGGEPEAGCPRGPTGPPRGAAPRSCSRSRSGTGIASGSSRKEIKGLDRQSGMHGVKVQVETLPACQISRASLPGRDPCPSPAPRSSGPPRCA